MVFSVTAMQKFEWESKFFLYWYNSSQTLVRVQIRFRDTRIVDDSFVCLCLYVVRARFVQRQSKRGSVTRLLSASKPDHLMDEIPTFVARVRAPSSSSSSSLLSYFLSLRFLNSRKPAANRRLCARSLRAVQQNHLNFTMDHRSRSFDICFFFCVLQSLIFVSFDARTEMHDKLPPDAIVCIIDVDVVLLVSALFALGV